MPKKFRDVYTLLKADGWYLDRHQGSSHRHFKHPVKRGTVTVNGEPGEDCNEWLYHQILKQAGIREL